MATAADALAGLRVLLVEDDVLVAEHLAAIVRSHSCEVVGPALDLRSGLKHASEAQLDGALLDIKLSGDFCFPIAVVLGARKIPFLFLTGGFGPHLLPPDLRAVRRLSKPIDPKDLSAALCQEFRDTGD